MLKIHKPIPLALSFFFAYFLLAGCSKVEVRERKEKTPAEVVIEWTKVYGIDMDKAAELTTLEFRDGKPKGMWASEMYKTLKLIGYKHLGGKVIEEKVEGNKALVILQAEIDTITGRSKQKEFYLLNKVDSTWLIDDIKVKEEEIEEKGGEALDKEA